MTETDFHLAFYLYTFIVFLLGIAIGFFMVDPSDEEPI